MGIGAPAGLNTWGSSPTQSRDYLMEAPHIAVFCCFPLIALLLALQVVLKEFDT